MTRMSDKNAASGRTQSEVISENTADGRQTSLYDFDADGREPMSPTRRHGSFLFFAALIISAGLMLAVMLRPAGNQNAPLFFGMLVLLLPAYWYAALSLDGLQSAMHQGACVLAVVIPLFVGIALKDAGWTLDWIVSEAVPEEEISRPSTDNEALAINAASLQADSFADRFDAEVWLTDMSGRLADQVGDVAERLDILTAVHHEASRAALPPELILAVIEVESGFDPYAISIDGKVGLMQIPPYWLGEIGRPDDNLIRIKTNLRYGCTILKYYLDQEQGDLRQALIRFDGTDQGREYASKVVDRLSRRWFRR